MKEIRTVYLYYAISLGPIMKPIRISSITKYIQTYATLYFMSYYFLPQRYKRDYVLFIKVEK